jgi:hypothetical protein
VTTTTFTRTWNAALIIDGEAMPLELHSADTQHDTIGAAVAIITPLLRRTFESAEFATYKTTKAHGTQADRRYIVRWSPRARRFVAEFVGAVSPSIVNPFAA